MTTIRVRLFARARDLAGAEAVELDLPAGATVAEMRTRLAQRVPALAGLLPRAAVAVNEDFAEGETVIPPGAEVALIPPVSGGDLCWRPLMSFDDLSEQANRRPFTPFRLYLTDGTSFDVRHPELFMLGRRAVVVGLTAAPDQKFFDRSTTIDLLHIMRTEPLGVATQANGEPTA